MCLCCFWKWPSSALGLSSLSKHYVKMMHCDFGRRNTTETKQQWEFKKKKALVVYICNKHMRIARLGQHLDIFLILGLLLCSCVCVCGMSVSACVVCVCVTISEQWCIWTNAYVSLSQTQTHTQTQIHKHRHAVIHTHTHTHTYRH